MKLFGLCFALLIASLAEAYSETVAKALTTREADNKFPESVATTSEAVLENITARTEEISELEIFDEFVNDILVHNRVTLQGSDADEGRTFGVKRLQFMLMPMMYKMGVMMTLLVVLTVISLKGLGIGILLLVLKLSAFFGKLYANSHQPGHGWTQPQPVHVHVHNNGGGSHHHPPHNGWESVSGYDDDEHYYYKG